MNSIAKSYKMLDLILALLGGRRTLIFKRSIFVDLILHHLFDEKSSLQLIRINQRVRLLHKPHIMKLLVGALKFSYSIGTHPLTFFPVGKNVEDGLLL